MDDRIESPASQLALKTAQAKAYEAREIEAQQDIVHLLENDLACGM